MSLLTNNTTHFSNFGSLKSTETIAPLSAQRGEMHFSNFGSLKSTETADLPQRADRDLYFSNFGSLKSTETEPRRARVGGVEQISAISAR